MIIGKIKETPLGGLSSTLSDYDCADGDMQVCHNLAHDGAGLKGIADVDVQLTLPAALTGVAFTHHTSTDGVIYIALTTDGKLAYGDEDGIQDEKGYGLLDTDFTLTDGKYSLTSAGDVLVLNVSDGSSNGGLHYFLCKHTRSGAAYEYIGQRPPDVGLQFEMYYPKKTIRSELDKIGKNIECIKRQLGGMPVLNFTTADYKQSAEDLGKWVTVADGFSVTLSNEVGFIFNKNEDVQNAVMASINEHVALCKQKSRFLQPFFVRYAYRLYDGSYIMQSSPVLMVPDYGLNPFCYTLYNSITQDFAGILLSRPMELRYRATISEEDKKALLKWKDIIQGVAIFVTPQIPCYAETGKEFNLGYIGSMGEGQTTLYEGYVENTNTRTMILQGGTFEADEDMTSAQLYKIKDVTSEIDEGSFGNESNERHLGGGFKREGSWNDWVLDTYAFYELKEYQLEELKYDGPWVSVKRTGGIESLETFTQLPDGYKERTVKNPKLIHTYNGRLNIANVDLKEYATMPMGSVAAYSVMGNYTTFLLGNQGNTYINGTFTVYIESGGMMNKAVIATGNWGYFSSWPGFFFYPNPDAKYLQFTGDVYKADDNSSLATNYDYWWKLKPHPYLHGAYYFRADFGYYNFTADGSAGHDETDTWEEGWIHQTNYLYTSEVDNPFRFDSANVEAIGSGEITAIKDSTKAMSQGTAFGTMPLYAFCTDGIWALEVGGTGAFTAKQPVSRETLLGGDPNAVTQIDNSIVFLSERGLMELSGGQTRLLSGALQGRGAVADPKSDLPRWNDIHAKFGEMGYLKADGFAAFVKAGARIAFDYANYRVVVYRPYAAGDADTHIAYVYGIGTKTWTTMDCRILSSLQGYPDTLLNLQGADGAVEVGRFTIAQTGGMAGGGKAFYVTRPLKLGEPDTLKTVRTLMERGVRNGGGTKYLALWGSRDMARWSLIGAVEGGGIPRLGGTPFKWFVAAGWTALAGFADRVSRLTLECVDKYTDKLR